MIRQVYSHSNGTKCSTDAVSRHTTGAEVTRRRRRERQIDVLASPQAVRSVLNSLIRKLPAELPSSERELVRMLRAASHCERKGWSQSLRGRPSRYDRGRLQRLWNVLTEELARVDRESVSPRTFTEHYLRLLSCPADVSAALVDGRINLFEALQLARLTPAAAGLTSSGASKLRSRVLAAHVASHASARQLYERINDLLGRSRRPEAGSPIDTAEPAEAASEAEEIDAETDAYLADPGALFADQLRQISIELARIDSDEITDAESSALFDLLDQLYLRASKVARRTND